jgi:hypothetical protein
MLFALRGRAKMSAVVLTFAAVAAFAESPAPASQDPPASEATSFTLPTIEVISQQLEAARLQIQPSLGASTYYFGPEALQTIPQGENAPLNQVLLQMPAVAQDSFGQIHVRGDHANVQFRINGVQLPEGLSVFGQALETRFARSVSLLTGALPAQYGFFTAGVLDIQTKTGLTNPGFAITMYGGSFNWLQPSFEFGGHEGPVDWFFTGDHLSNERGIENPIRPTMQFTTRRSKSTAFPICPALSIPIRGSACLAALSTDVFKFQITRARLLLLASTCLG